MSGVAFRYNHNFRLAFSGELGYSFLPFDCRYAQTDYPQAREANQATRGVSHLLTLNGWAEYNFAHYSDKFRYLQTRSLVPYIGAGLSVGTTLSGAQDGFPARGWHQDGDQVQDSQSP